MAWRLGGGVSGAVDVPGVIGVIFRHPHTFPARVGVASRQCDPEWTTVENAGLFDTVKIAPTNTNGSGEQKKVRRLMIVKRKGKE